MDQTEFETKLKTLIKTEYLYEHIAQLPSVAPENRWLFLQAVALGYSVPEVLRMHSEGRLTEETIKNSLQQKMLDNTSEIQA